MMDGGKRRTSLKQHQCFASSRRTVKLRTIIDGHKCNDNTEKDIKSLIDMSNAYEQIRMEPKDVWKTVFATIYGTFVSHTMQQGDCNSPATFQWLMTVIF